ncbi:DUF3617 family protein [Sphingobium sp. AP49]|uniref:DUF3617 domain-containing protein n=1 Tax=Sphingobium sp. AP49 TaxID=1144307 RepID=UPI001EE6711D|nr:DUF3617 family protein [Sphingobium sp. AP49]WHO38634.1 DUF3617 family protein [Sphingobium sp. AP49]
MLLSLSSSSDAADANEPIIVTAAKLRRVGIDYDARGRDLIRCTITRTSGEDRVDQAMCELVRLCVADGHGRRRDAQACVSERIAVLADAEMEAEDVVLVRPAALAQARQPIESVVLPGPQISLPPVEQDAGILVTGSRYRIRPGLWEIEKGRMFSRMVGWKVIGARPQSSLPPPPPGYRYQLCLSRSDAETLQQFVDDHFEREGLKGCMMARMEVEEGRLSVTRSCPSRYGTIDMRLSAQLAAERIEGIMLGTTDTGRFQAEDRYLLNGRRIGECPPSRPEGAAGRD